MPIRNFYCVSEAGYTLGIENQFTLKEMVKQNTVIQSPSVRASEVAKASGVRTKFYPFPVLLVSLAPIYPDSPFLVTPDL